MSSTDPCWHTKVENFATADNQMIEQRKERNLLESFGFPSDTPVSEALQIFNDELKCSPLFKDYEPLTESELFAAIIVGANENGRGSEFRAERDALWKIVTTRVLPKGSILRAHNGGNIQNSPAYPNKTVVAKGVEVILILGADANGRSGFPPAPRQEQMVKIRKTFQGITVK